LSALPYTFLAWFQNRIDFKTYDQDSPIISKKAFRRWIFYQPLTLQFSWAIPDHSLPKNPHRAKNIVELGNFDFCQFGRIPLGFRVSSNYLRGRITYPAAEKG
jgi:hypothetical protein